MDTEAQTQERSDQVVPFEQCCDLLRKEIQATKGKLIFLNNHPVFASGDQSNEGQINASRNGEMHANITLAFRHLEDARMRIGKAMQAFQGGTSIYDK